MANHILQLYFPMVRHLIPKNIFLSIFLNFYRPRSGEDNDSIVLIVFIVIFFHGYWWWWWGGGVVVYPSMGLDRGLCIPACTWQMAVSALEDVCYRGCLGRSPNPHEMATDAVGTHPTGMYPVFFCLCF